MIFNFILLTYSYCLELVLLLQLLSYCSSLFNFTIIFIDYHYDILYL